MWMSNAQCQYNIIVHALKIEKKRTTHKYKYNTIQAYFKTEMAMSLH